MPAVSKKQFGFMAAVASGIKKVKGLNPWKAREFLHVKVSSLPTKIKGNKK